MAAGDGTDPRKLTPFSFALRPVAAPAESRPPYLGAITTYIRRRPEFRPAVGQRRLPVRRRTAIAVFAVSNVERCQPLS